MKVLQKNRTIHVALYLTALLIFATACNWIGMMNPWGEPEDTPSVDAGHQQSTPVSTTKARQQLASITPTNLAPIKGAQALIEGKSTKAPDISTESASEATAAAIIAQLKVKGANPSNEAKSTASAIVDQLTQVRDGLKNKRATIIHHGTIQDELVNIRRGPDTGYPILTQVVAGQTLGVTGRNEAGNWLQVCCPAPNEERGWLLASLLDVPELLPNILEAIPIVDVPEVSPPKNRSSEQNTHNGANTAAGLPANGGFPAPSSVNPLTGLALPAGRSNQRPMVVCINNDFVSRPQFGTSQADVMYEYLMEGYGITRFSGVFYGTEVAQIGPIRSARLINVYMEGLYDAGLACSGASDRVRYILKHESPYPYMDVDLDDPSNIRYSTNVGSDYRTRLRTDTSKLNQFLIDWDAQKPASIRGFSFGSLSMNGVSATWIDIPYPGASRSTYQYDGGRGLYLRSMGGTPHVDGNNGAHLALENIIVQYVTHETTDIVEDSLGSLSIRLNLFGNGRSIIFRDGQAFDGTWRSDSGGDTPRFYGMDGSEIFLKPGRSWISIVPQNYNINYQ